MKRIIYYLLPLMAALYSCADDYADSELKSNAGMVDVTFSVTTPGQSPYTYAQNVDETKSNKIKTVDLLAFKIVGNDKKFAYRSKATKIDDVKKEFTATVFVDKYNKYHFVVLANSTAIIDKAYPSGIAKETLMSTVLEELTTKKELTEKWEGDANKDYFLPMWGEKDNVEVTENLKITDLKLLRMLALINVELKSTLSADKFTLEEVHLYRYYTDGMLVPDKNQLDTVQGKYKMKLPTIKTGWVPAPDVNQKAPTLCYKSSDKKTLLNTIYTFESKVPGGAANPDLGQVTCVVIGGKYNKESKTSYYRVDFGKKKPDGKREYYNLVRNHSYSIIINDVLEGGFDDEDEAYRARAKNIEAEIVEWDDNVVMEGIFDGQYVLGMSHKEIHVDSDPHTFKDFIVRSDYPYFKSKYKLEVFKDAACTMPFPANELWLNIKIDNIDSPAVVNGFNEYKTTLNITKANIMTQPEVAYIRIQAGRLKLTAKVIQATPLTLDITNTSDQALTELVFWDKATGSEAQKFKVKWVPKNLTVTAASRDITFPGFRYAPTSPNKPGTSQDFEYTASNGTKTLEILPSTLLMEELNTNPFIEKRSELHFTVSEGERSRTKKLVLRQNTYHLLVDKLAPYHLLNGREYSFRVRCNTNWAVRSVKIEDASKPQKDLTDYITTDSRDAIKDAAGGSNYNVLPDSGTIIKFQTVPAESIMRGTMIIVFKSTDSPAHFNDVTVRIPMNEFYPRYKKLQWAGSNIYFDPTTKKYTFDDVGVTTHAKYQGVKFKWGSMSAVCNINVTPQTMYFITPDIINQTYKMSPVTDKNNNTWMTHASLEDFVEAIPPAEYADEDRAYLYEITTKKTSAGDFGDICRYMTLKGMAPGGKKWRMPTLAEYRTLIFTSASGTPGDSGIIYAGSTEKRVSGQDVMGYHWVATTRPQDGSKQVIFPAAGYIENNKTTWTWIHNENNKRVSYWTSSPMNFDTGAYALYNSTFGYPLNYGRIGRQVGQAIRCVVDEDAD
ncbi:hypothetical protein [Bacteroides reticulotermitis]|uniref:hypothetical protein n=1 Tax=Bacteroides reticulotermitis TaxID=1133319 RepID=UPI003A896A38